MTIHRSLVASVASMILAPGLFAAYPAGFQALSVSSGFSKCVGLTFAPDGRIFVVEQRGMVWVVDNGTKSIFLDLRQEVGFGQDRGLLGIALDPNFLENHHVYLLYTVDPIFGDPDEPPDTESFGRLTRYTGTTASGGNVADPDSRFVLIGEDPSQGIPGCHASHHIGSLRFGFDGSLFLSAGDGAHYDFTDGGGADDPCFVRGMFSEDQDIGAFRSQYLMSHSGKILRIDPATGLGLPDNPFYTGDPSAEQSRVWAYGLRNPFRFTIRPDSPSPGTLYVGDVGWNTYEEINIAHGGENFGWPCFESPLAAPDYPNLNPPVAGCDTIGTAENPGVLTSPVVWWHHGASGLSFPTGFIGRCSVGGAFYPGGNYPTKYHGKMFVSDFIQNWIRVLTVDGADKYVSFEPFATVIGGGVEFAIHPTTHELYFATTNGVIRRLKYSGIDLTGDGLIDGADLGVLLANWGNSGIGDYNGDGVVDGADLGTLLSSWS